MAKLFDKPVHALSDREIEDYYKHERPIGKTWGGHFMRDALPKKMRKNSAIIINLDDSTGPGTHYVCLIRLPFGSYYYDDSFGVDCPVEVDKLTDGEKLFVQTEQDQLPHEITCGYECIATINGFIEAGLIRKCNDADKTGGEIALKIKCALTEKPVSRPTLEQLWEAPETGFVGLAKFKQNIKQHGYSNEEIKKFWASRLENQQAKRLVQKKSEQRPIESLTGEFGNLQMDLLDVSSIAANNNQVRYLLTAIDIQTRLAFAEPITKKEASKVAEAARKIFDQVDGLINLVNKKEPMVSMTDMKTGEITKEKPKFAVHIQTDNGSEFKGSFRKEMEKRGYTWHMNDTTSVGQHSGMAMVERLNQTIRGRIFRAAINRPKRRYIDLLKQIVVGYNNSVNEGINKTPVKALMQELGLNLEKVLAAVPGKGGNEPLIEGRMKAKFLPGEKVRVYLKRPDNIQGDKMAPRWSLDVYEIVGKHGKNRYEVVPLDSKAPKYTPRLAREIQLVPNEEDVQGVETAKVNEVERVVANKARKAGFATKRELADDVGQVPEILTTKRVRKPNPKFL